MQRNFNGYEQGPDFDRARSMIATPFQYVDIALDVAGVNASYNVSGDFLYVDASSTGTATLELNNQYNDPSAPFQISAGFGLQALFKQLKLTWTAQAGKRLRLMYSTGDKVVPTNSTTISGSVSVVQTGYSYTNSHQAYSGMAANTPATIFTPAANVKGAIVVAAQIQTHNPSGVSVMIAKNAAPASITDGDVILAQLNSAAYIPASQLQTPIFIAAGLGLYTICNVAETNGFRAALYTLL